MNTNKIIYRYAWMVFIIILFGLGIFAKTVSVMYKERGYWEEVASRYVNDSVVVKAVRGNIFSSDDKLMASSIPQYDFIMDLNSNQKQKQLLRENITAISNGLHKIFPDKSARFFKNQIETGMKRNNRGKLIYPTRRISYIELQKIKELPVLSSSNKYLSGLTPKEYNHRNKPFKSLASRTIGELYADVDMGAKNGIEQYFDKELKGIEGRGHRQKIRKKTITVVDKAPINGSDIITTINVDMQDISEKALVDVLHQNNASKGIVILMEVKTGDIKAIVNMTRNGSRGYSEQMNHALADLYEQGSTIKTASILIALDDNKITPTSTQDLGDGIYKMYNTPLKDFNFRTGGFKDNKIKTIQEIMMFSSNIGVAKTIEDAYRDDKQRFVDRYREMLGMELDLPIVGVGKPMIRNTTDKLFSKTTLPWMSFGYETSLPAINVATFYNAVANNGKMMAPRLVQSINKDGRILKEFPTKVINSQIASKAAIKEIQTMLELVVSDGLGKRAGSEQFKVAGKTGTAQVSKGEGGYKGPIQHLLSFAGYFPAENPEYSCLVSLVSTTSGGGGGGLQAAAVFKEVAERVYAMKIKSRYESTIEKGEAKEGIPEIKRGLYRPTIQVMKELDIDYSDSEVESDTKYIDSKILENNKIELVATTTKENLMPSVYGMGAKDAVHKLESIGMDVILTGKGKVYRQSIAAGQKAKAGTTIRIELR